MLDRSSYHFTRYQIPSIALALLGFAIGASQLVSYLQYRADPPTHRLGLLSELARIIVLFASLLVIGIGIYGLRRERPVLPVVVLVGVLAFLVTLRSGLYSAHPNTQFVLALGVIATVVPTVVTYLVVRFTPYWTG